MQNHPAISFSHIYTPGTIDGLFIGLNDQAHIDEILENWPYQNKDGSNGPDICVITDGSRILGLGDQGINGMPIPIGKLSLYIACSGFNPSRTLPITLDLGTNRQEYLDDPLYLGSKTARPPQRRVLEFMDVLMAAMHKRWPNMVIQFEDFSTENVSREREKEVVLAGLEISHPLLSSPSLVLHYSGKIPREISLLQR